MYCVDAVYCRTAPVEYASLSPSVDLLGFAYPAACKSLGQRYAAITMRRLRNPANAIVTRRPIDPAERAQRAARRSAASLSAGAAAAAASASSASWATSRKSRRTMQNIRSPSSYGLQEADDDLSVESSGAEEIEVTYPSRESLVAQPLFLIEIAALGEVLQTSASAITSLRFAKLVPEPPLFSSCLSYDEQQQQPAHRDEDDTGAQSGKSPEQGGGQPGLVCVVPLYEWVLITEDVIRNYDRDALSEDTAVDSMQLMVSGSRAETLGIAMHDRDGAGAAAGGGGGGGGESQKSAAISMKHLADAFAESGLPCESGGEIAGRGFAASADALLHEHRHHSNHHGRGQHRLHPNALHKVSDSISVVMLDRELARKRLHKSIVEEISAQGEDVIRSSIGVSALSHSHHAGSGKSPHVQGAHPHALSTAAHDLQVSAATAIKENEARLRDAAEAQAAVAAARRKALSLHSQLCANEHKVREQLMLSAAVSSSAVRFRSTPELPMMMPQSSGDGTRHGIPEDMSTMTMKQQSQPQAQVQQARGERKTGSAIIIDAISAMNTGALHTAVTATATGDRNAGASGGRAAALRSDIARHQSKASRLRLELMDALVHIPSKKDVVLSIRGARQQKLKGNRQTSSSSSSSLAVVKSSSADVNESAPNALALKLDVLHSMLNQSMGVVEAAADVAQTLAFVDTTVPITETEREALEAVGY